MNKAIIGFFAALAFAGCATTPSTTSRSAVKPAAPAETGIQGKQAWNGLIVVVPRGIFSCDAAVRKVARTYKLFEETKTAFSLRGSKMKFYSLQTLDEAKQKMRDFAGSDVPFCFVPLYGGVIADKLFYPCCQYAMNKLKGAQFINPAGLGKFLRSVQRSSIAVVNPSLCKECSPTDRIYNIFF